MARIDTFLRLVVEQRASDLHLGGGAPPAIRSQGDLVFVRFRSLSDVEAKRFLREILSPEQAAEFDRSGELDFAYEVPGIGRFRVNLYVQAGGMAGAFRVIPSEPPTLDGLGLPKVLGRLVSLDSGLVLVTGPTGSGKSTTLAAMVEHVNREAERHVLTIEDPIEFVYTPRRSLISQREIGRHASSFADALRAAMRAAPDVILVGELRDSETISMALSAASSGSLVLATLHTSSAAQTVDRIVDSFAEDQQDQVRGTLAMVLRGVVSQQLCKTADGTRRVAAVEVLVASLAVANMIRENKAYQIPSYMETAGFEATGMETMDQCLMRLVRRGEIAAETARFHAMDRVRFDRMVEE
ncbi:type IV pilus twitching motility protein PilT [Myxococcota bacterium]|nr:type IV pilus twitching motility protein PilT [Myxococcota bacterium]